MSSDSYNVFFFIPKVRDYITSCKGRISPFCSRPLFIPLFIPLLSLYPSPLAVSFYPSPTSCALSLSLSSLSLSLSPLVLAKTENCLQSDVV